MNSESTPSETQAKLFEMICDLFNNHCSKSYRLTSDSRDFFTQKGLVRILEALLTHKNITLTPEQQAIYIVAKLEIS